MMIFPWETGGTFTFMAKQELYTNHRTCRHMFKKKYHVHTSSIKILPCSFDMLVYQTVDWNDPTVSKSEVVPVKRIMKKIPSDPQTSNT